MRLRLSDATTSALLAEHYRAQAEMCHQMARMTVSPFKEGCGKLTILGQDAPDAPSKRRRVFVIELPRGCPTNNLVRDFWRKY
jgi:hypothetical protein